MPRTTRPSLLLLAAALGGAAAGGASFASRPGEQRPSIDLTEASPAREGGGEVGDLAWLDGKIAGLFARVTRLAAERVPTPTEEAARVELSGNTTDDTGPGRLPPAEELVAEADEQRRDHLARVEETFRQETPDRDWARSAETAIRNLGRATETAPSISAAECRAETCRIEVASAAPLNDWFPRFAQEAAEGDFGGITIDQGVGPSGRPISILYMARRNRAEP